MSESPTFRPDQATSAASQQYGEQFNAPTALVQPEADFLSDNNSTDAITQATTEAHQAYEATPANEKLVFADKRGDFEIRQQQPEQVSVTTQPNMLDDSYAEMVRERQKAAELQAEHAAIEAENVRAIAATGQIIGASRDYAEAYGLAA